MQLDKEFVNAYREREIHGENPLFASLNGLGYVVFKRTYARRIDGEDRTEEWFETVERVVNGAAKIAEFNDEELERLYDYIWNLKGLPSGRALWQLGTTNVDRIGGDSLVNCWFVDIQDYRDFSWMMERLMLGGGVGFSVTKPKKIGKFYPSNVYDVSDKAPPHYKRTLIVEDSREGWAELIDKVFYTYTRGYDLHFTLEKLRPAGAPIKGFGGVSSGPEPLRRGIRKICDILDRVAEGTGKLTSVDVLDISNIIGEIVVSGNVRRSAQIALGDPDDELFLGAKDWSKRTIPNHRAMSNNTVYASRFEDLGPAFWEGYLGNGEPYGIFNVNAARQQGRTGEHLYDPTIVGVNPCGEIPLGHRESCNLSEVVLPNIDSQEEFDAVAGLLYRVQKAIAGLSYLDKESDRITTQNMRLGLGLTGVAMATEEQLLYVKEGYKALRHLDKENSKRLGLPESVRLTAIQPSGTKSLLAGVTPGGHPGFSRFHIRRVRMAWNDPIADFCKEIGVPWEPSQNFDGTLNEDTLVFSFPVELPAKAKVSKDMTAIDQLELVRRLQADWADNAVSVTIYYKLSELADIRAWMRDHWGEFKSLSFLLHSDHGFVQAPLEEIEGEEYERLRAEFQLEIMHNPHGEVELLDSDCEGGACPVR